MRDFTQCDDVGDLKSAYSELGTEPNITTSPKYPRFTQPPRTTSFTANIAKCARLPRPHCVRVHERTAAAAVGNLQPLPQLFILAH